MEEETVGELLKRLLAQKGISQRRFANLSGVDRGYINSLIRGKGGSISLRIARQFASALGVLPEIFLKSTESTIDKERPEYILERLRIKMPLTIPIYDDFPFHAGEPLEFINHVAIIRERVEGKNLEGYFVKGNCLEPDIQDGDIIIVERDGQMESGDIIACLFNDNLYLARLIKTEEGYFLENNYGKVKLDEVQLAAPVIEVRRRLK